MYKFSLSVLCLVCTKASLITANVFVNHVLVRQYDLRWVFQSLLFKCTDYAQTTCTCVGWQKNACYSIQTKKHPLNKHDPTTAVNAPRNAHLSSHFSVKSNRSFQSIVACPVYQTRAVKCENSIFNINSLCICSRRERSSACTNVHLLVCGCVLSMKCRHTTSSCNML